jgi:hypothetical protein
VALVVRWRTGGEEMPAGGGGSTSSQSSVGDARQQSS